MSVESERLLAEKFGAKAILDPARGGEWCLFELNGWRIWQSRNWIAAMVVDDHYINQCKFDSLEEAFELASSNPAYVSRTCWFDRCMRLRGIVGLRG